MESQISAPASIAPTLPQGRTIFIVNRFFHPDHSATGQIASDLAFHLAARGMRVAAIAGAGLYDDPSADLAPFEQAHGVDIHRVRRPRYGRATLGGRAFDMLAMHRAFAAALARFGRPGDCVIAKTDPPLLSVALAPVARARRMALVNWLQDLYPEVALDIGAAGMGVVGRAARAAAPALIAARNSSLRAARANVAIGERMAGRVAEAGVARERIAIIHNWCDDTIIRPLPAEGHPLRAAWGLAGRFVVGYSGNLGRAHEFRTLLDAAGLLREEKDIRFLFIGGGHLTGALQAEVSARALGDAFQFRPYQSAADLPLSLTAPDVHWLSLAPAMEGLIVPSKFYGIAAAGRPTLAVTAPDGEIARLVQRHHCGLAIAPGDGAGLADAIRALRAEPDRRAAMGRNARALIDARFSRAHALAAWEALVAATALADK